jgi:hypothetical protein
VLGVVAVGACAGVRIGPYQPGTGLKSCDLTAGMLSGRARVRTGLGVASAIAGAAAAISGAAMGPDTREGAKWYEKDRNVLAVGVGALLAVFAKYEFDQSDAASDAASAMHGAMAGNGNDLDRTAYDACVTAVATYDASGKTTNADVQKQIAALSAKTDQVSAKTDAVSAKTDAVSVKSDEAKTLAVEAKTTADRATSPQP